VVDGSGALSFNIKGLLLLGLAVFSAAGYNMTLGRLWEVTARYFVNMQNILGVILFARFLSLPISITSFRRRIHFFLLPVMELALFASCGAFILSDGR
jgi:hypothetical protein